MDTRLSDMVDAALRWHTGSTPPSPADIERCWPALAELLQSIGWFARDMERTDALEGADELRRSIGHACAAEHLYGRLLDPPHADNVVPLPAGIARVAAATGRTA